MRGDRSTLRAVKGPIILITLGILFALQSFNICGFDQTWPVLLIVVGLLSLMGRAAAPPPPPPPAQNWTNVPPYPPYTWPGQAQTADRGPSYAQTPYAQPAPATGSSPQDAGPSKGGFGTSAPPR